MKQKICVVVHNVRSAYNVGAIFRTADAFGASGIYLTGYTPPPSGKNKIYKTRAQKMIAKTALGAESTVIWKRVKKIGEVIEKLRAKGFEIVALEQNKKSIMYDKFKPRFPLALILGNEPKGINGKILKKCDAIIEIPMCGRKNSLNVAVALGIAGYQLTKH